jgi:hypothetical protein
MLELLGFAALVAFIVWFMRPKANKHDTPRVPPSHTTMEGLGRFVRKVRQGQKPSPPPEARKTTSSKSFEL